MPVILLALLTFQIAASAQDAVYVMRVDDHQHIFQTGDTLTSSILLHLPGDMHILQGSLPETGLLNDQLALIGREIKMAEQPTDGEELMLHYLWLGGARNEEPAILPGLSISVAREDGVVSEVKIPEGTMATSPRYAPDATDESIRLQPLHEFENSISPGNPEAFGTALLMVNIFVCMAVIYFFLAPRWRKSPDGFRKLLRQVQRAGEQTTPPELFFRQFHEVLYTLAGRNLDPWNLDDFIRLYPDFAPLTGELEACLFAARDRLYRSPDGQQVIPLPASEQERWLKLIRQCARIEQRLPQCKP